MDLQKQDITQVMLKGVVLLRVDGRGYLVFSKKLIILTEIKKVLWNTLNPILVLHNLL
tara:strand:- start:92 stop:265 length:174 start_codon:yes stop_codon:yes gene_type:complete